jgi:hypothetical protein
MHLGIATDHGGFALKEELGERLLELQPMREHS